MNDDGTADSGKGREQALRAHPVLQDLTFRVGRGEMLGLLGPNGSRKTTTIRLLNGVIRPDGGQIAVAGYNPVHNGDAIRRRSGILTESAGFYLPLMLLVIPMISLLAILLNVLISARVATFQAAYQMGGLVVLPVVGLIIGQAMGALLDAVVMLIAGVALAAVNTLLPADSPVLRAVPVLHLADGDRSGPRSWNGCGRCRGTRRCPSS